MKIRYIKSFTAVLVSAWLLASCSDNEPVKPDDTPPEPAPADTVPNEEPAPEPEPSFAPEFVAGKIAVTTEGGAAIKSKENYVQCSVSVSHDNDEWNLESIPGGIRGRGNSTWEWYPKKPYRIKFDKKQSLLGLGAAKSWVLLAEYRDPTDLMNAFVFELGRLMGLPFTNHNRYVEVTLNGDYIGLYHLTEQVQQGKERVNIDEDKGYLIQLDRDDGPELSPSATDNFWSEVYGMPVCVKNPDEPSSDILSEVKADLGELEKAVKAGSWASVQEMLDVGTMVDFIIVQELIYNVELDAPRSMYMHKDVGGIWTMGPLWDFDAGFDFDWSTMTTGHSYFSDYKELVLGTDPRNHTGTAYRVPGFFSDLFKMAEFTEMFKKRWEEVCDMIDPAWENAYTFYFANREAFAREYRRWPIDRNYSTEIIRMKNWLMNRRNYLSTIIRKY